MKRARNNWKEAAGLSALIVAGLMLAPAPARAASTHSSENLILATATLDRDVEMVVAFDIVSGTLRAYVMNTNTRKFFASYMTRSVATDLGVPKGKNPKYTLVTGGANFKAQGGSRLGSCVIYIAEENSGNLGAYAVNWESSQMNQKGFVDKPFLLTGPVVKVGAGGPRAAGATEEETGK